MSNGQKRCGVCGDGFVADARTRRFQKVCPKPDCRRVRKQQADARWRSKNEGYDASRAAKKRVWAKTYPHYWQTYRTADPDYAQRNREQTRERVKRSRLLFANQDAIRMDPVGYLAGLQGEGLFANQDAMAHSIEGILTFLRVREGFANPNAMVPAGGPAG